MHIYGQVQSTVHAYMVTLDEMTSQLLIYSTYINWSGFATVTYQDYSRDDEVPYPTVAVCYCYG